MTGKKYQEEIQTERKFHECWSESERRFVKVEHHFTYIVHPGAIKALTIQEEHARKYRELMQ